MERVRPTSWSREDENPSRIIDTASVKPLSLGGRLFLTLNYYRVKARARLFFHGWHVASHAKVEHRVNFQGNEDKLLNGTVCPPSTSK